jgi:hypothetical protein
MMGPTDLIRAAALAAVVAGAGVAAAGAQAAQVNGLAGVRNQVSISYGPGSGGCFHLVATENGQPVCMAYSSTALQAEGVTPGSTVKVGGINFAWPNTSAGQPDSMSPTGQTIPVDPPLGTNTLALLGACHNGPFQVEVDLTYSTADADGNTTDVEFVTVPDWWGTVANLGNPTGAGPSGLWTPFLMLNDLGAVPHSGSAYAMTLPVDATRRLVSVSFPPAALQSDGQTGIAFFDMQLLTQ